LRKLEAEVRTFIAYAVSSAAGGLIFSLMMVVSVMADQARAPVEGISIPDVLATNLLIGTLICATFGFAIVSPVYWAFRQNIPIKSDILCHLIFGAVVWFGIVFTIFLFPVEGSLSYDIGNFADGRPTAKGLELAVGNATAAALIGASCGVAFGCTSASLKSRAQRKC